METFALYLIKSSVWLTGFALVYLLFLRNERFFVLNRIYLVSGILVSIIFPLFTWHYTVVLPVVATADVFEPQMVGTTVVNEPFPTQTILLYIYLAGAIYLLFRVIRQTIAVLRVIRKSETLPFSSAKLIRTTEYPASFSFFSFVFVNPSTSDTETNEIVNHELEHIRQQHWIDLLLFEILCTIQWFNPASWLYGRFIRQNHEYLADERALQRCSNPAIYRAALLNQMFGGPVIVLANSFNYSLNKKRFNMMKQIIHSPIRKFKLLLVVPLIAGVFYAFSAPEYKFVQAEDLSQVGKIVSGKVITEDGNPLQGASVIVKGTTVGTITDASGNFKEVTQKRKTVIGKVVTEDGNPLQGASVIVKGTTIGTITDASGNFKLEMPDGWGIVISYVGFKTIDLPSALENMTLTMKRTNIGIDKITVASSYGNTPPPPSMDFDSKNPPLFILDGKTIEKSEMDKIKPETIESIEVLKDESSKALYGEKGKNGVILITSKKKGITIRSTDGNTTKPLYIVEGFEKPESLAKNINPDDIESVNVLKGENAINKYGDKGKNGVIEIKLKTSLPPPLSGGDVTQKNTKEEEVFVVVEEMPEFPGGVNALRQFLARTMKYPLSAQEKGIQGTVFISFVVSKDGSVSNAKVARGIDPSLDKEAVRVVESMPDWKPGKQRGMNVDVSFTIPIEFVLQSNTTNSEKPAITNKSADNVFVVVEEMPEFPGGVSALRTFIQNSIKYPVAALENYIQGRVYVKFVITKTGIVINPEIARSLDPTLDKEAIRVVGSLPKWKPGKQGGVNVDVYYTVPVSFQLETKLINENLKVVPNTGSDTYTVVEEMPQFPGGTEALKTFVNSTMKYPTLALENGIQGKVTVKFVVDKTGSVTNARLYRIVDPSLNKEALRIVEAMPKWIPGKQKGEAVDVTLEMPINFMLPPNRPSKQTHTTTTVTVFKATKTKPTVDPSAKTNNLIIVPNPTKDKATITLEGSDSKNKLEVSIYDRNGKIIKTESKNGPTFSLSFANFTSGTYLIVAKDGTTQYTGHLVVNH
jgi:TonB family protein